MVEKLPQENPFAESNLEFFSTHKSKILVVGLVFLGLFLISIGAGLFLFRNFGTNNEDIKIISGSQSAVLGEVVVHVDGAVNAPGIYKLSGDFRVNDAISAAGGFAPNADTARVNLAAKIADGQKIHVAAIGEVGSGFANQLSVSSQSDLISINEASEAQLDKLPGVGPVTASKIISLRPYSSLDDLVGKKAVNRSTFEKIKDLIRL